MEKSFTNALQILMIFDVFGICSGYSVLVLIFCFGFYFRDSKLEGALKFPLKNIFRDCLFQVGIWQDTKTLQDPLDMCIADIHPLLSAIGLLNIFSL